MEHPWLIYAHLICFVYALYGPRFEKHQVETIAWSTSSGVTDGAVAKIEPGDVAGISHRFLLGDGFYMFLYLVAHPSW